MKQITLKAANIQRLVELIDQWSNLDISDPDDEDWENSMHKVLAIRAMLDDLLEGMGEKTLDRNEVEEQMLERNPFYLR
jgi:hypothetical protein